MLEVYHHGSSVCAARVRLVLFEKEIEWNGHYVDILAGDQFSDAYLSINPRGTVPAIIHDGEIISESTIICEYLDDTFEGPRLKPETPLGKARMRGWMKLVDEEIHPATRPVTYVTTHRHTILARGIEAVEEHIASDPHPLWRERKRDWIMHGFEAADVADAVGTFVKLLQDMEAALATSEWLAGEAFTLADVALTPYANRLEMLGLSGMWDDKPAFARWFEAVKARESFLPALFVYMPTELQEKMLADGRRAWPEFQRIFASLER